jgi:hypothetical protein
MSSFHFCCLWRRQETHHNVMQPVTHKSAVVTADARSVCGIDGEHNCGLRTVARVNLDPPPARRLPKHIRLCCLNHPVPNPTHSLGVGRASTCGERALVTDEPKICNGLWRDSALTQYLRKCNSAWMRPAVGRPTILTTCVSAPVAK